MRLLGVFVTEAVAFITASVALQLFDPDTVL